jgi:transcriptional regulator NrdR family protein
MEDRTQATEKQEERRGIECPRCGCKHFRVLYTRRALGGRILRRRECRHCGRRVTTYEQTLGNARQVLDA